MARDFDPSRCERFIERIAGAGSLALDTDFIAEPAVVLAAVSDLGITGADFEEIDERPAQFDSRYRSHGWHIALRRVRNDGDNDLFERLDANNRKDS